MENIYEYKNSFRKREHGILLQQCRVCKQWKRLSEFHKETKKFITENGKIKIEVGHRTKCKECQSKYAKKWREENKEYKKNLDAFYYKKYKYKKLGIKFEETFDFKTNKNKYFNEAFNKFKKQYLKKFNKKNINQHSRYRERNLKILKIWKEKK